MNDLAERLASVQGSIADAARDAGRNPHEVTTIVVTKFQPVSLIRDLVELGVHDIGENRHQEAQQKAAELADLDALVEHVLATPGLRLRGLMSVAPLGEPPRPAFARVRLLSERVQRIAPEAGSLSMGMSHDFRDAILEGATHLRIGTAITGNRPDAG